jgi:hypothetical protein
MSGAGRWTEAADGDGNTGAAGKQGSARPGSVGHDRSCRGSGERRGATLRAPRGGGVNR